MKKSNDKLTQLIQTLNNKEPVLFSSLLNQLSINDAQLFGLLSELISKIHGQYEITCIENSSDFYVGLNNNIL